MAYKFDCLLFNGYKPCKYKRSCDGCEHYSKISRRIAIVSLEAMGAVLRSTVLLAPIRRKYPACHITWITYKASRPLLDQNPLIDRVIVLDHTTTALLQHLQFDHIFAVDKSLEAGALVEEIKGEKKLGFGLDANGVIRPLNKAAEYQYDVGLNDELKFYINQKPETEQITETMELKFQRDPYVLHLTPDEKEEARRRKQLVRQNLRGVIGYNTGCSPLFSNKKFTIKRSIEIIGMWRKLFPQMVVALYGGKEDCERNAQMKWAFADDPYVYNTPTDEGLRSGILWMDTADILLSGCSLGLHIGIALGKPAIAWFGVSCAQEIDLYDKGIKLKAEMSCTPCWKKSCDVEVKCYDRISAESIGEATKELIANHL